MSEKRSGSLFLTGLFLTTLATLMLEILDTRLLSVIAWYHLSFFAVSVAMFGMAAGAVHVYLGGDRFSGDLAPRALARYATLLAVAIPVSHLVNLSIPFPPNLSAVAVLAIGASTVALAAPFYASGVVVAIALTRMPGRIGVFYAADLLGAALGCLLVLPLLAYGNISSAAFTCGAVAAGAALCFRSAGRLPGRRLDAAVLVALGLIAVLSSVTPFGPRVLYPKGKPSRVENIEREFWSIHGQVVADYPTCSPVFYWGAGALASEEEVDLVGMRIDGLAGTMMTGWHGDAPSLEWAAHDVTALPYHLRRGARVAVVGVGGGRDLLTALWSGSPAIVGIEINRAFLEMIRGPYREFAGLADRPELKLVHDEARSYLARTRERYGILQMSLIDTWAATGAGAFTLSENGLYTLEAWELFLGRLEEDGLLSVSRWFAPENASETCRLVSLATGALLAYGVENPRRHMALVAAENIATLIVSPSPLPAADLAAIRALATAEGFNLLLLPGESPGHELIGRIASSRSLAEIGRTIAAEQYDYSIPTDARPFFFNLVRPSQILRIGLPRNLSPGVVRGNLLATFTLAVLLLVVLVLVAAVIFVPLLRRGLPRLSGRQFTLGLLYFALIGMGFMFIQIGLMQRFSVLLGHPVHAVVVILFTMIASAGIGSWLSERIPAERSAAGLIALPLATALLLVVTLFALQPLIAGSMAAGLLRRSLAAILLVAPLSLLLGMFFPTGMRLVGRLSEEAMPWMWAINGGCGVLAAVIAVAVSMWLGIEWNLIVAAGAYALLTLPALLLRRASSG